MQRRDDRGFLIPDRGPPPGPAPPPPPPPPNPYAPPPGPPPPSSFEPSRSSFTSQDSQPRSSFEAPRPPQTAAELFGTAPKLDFVMDVGENPAPPGAVPLPGMAAPTTPAARPPSLAQYGTGGSSAFGSQMSYGSNYSNDDASYGATAPGVLGMGQAAPGAYLCANQSVCRVLTPSSKRRVDGERAVNFDFHTGAYVSPRTSFEDVPFNSPGVSDMRAYDAYNEPPTPAPRRSRLATFSAWLLRLAILVHGMAALAHYAQESDLLMHGPPIPPPALKFLAPSAMPHDTPQKRRLLALSVFEALVRVVAAYEGATSASVAGLAALAYASDAAAFLTEAYVHPGPRMPPPETGRDDLVPGLAHAIVAVLVYALLARRRRCCESKQRSGKRE